MTSWPFGAERIAMNKKKGGIQIKFRNSLVVRFG